MSLRCKLFDLPLGSRFRYLSDNKRVYVLLNYEHCGLIADAPEGPTRPGQSLYSAAMSRGIFRQVMVEFVPVRMEK